MPPRSDVFGSPGVLEDDELPSISDTIRFACYLRDNKEGGCVSLQSLVYEVKTAILEKWSHAGQLFSSSSPLLMSDKAIVTLLTRTFASALDCIGERGRKVTRDKFLLKSGGLLNLLKCKCEIFSCSAAHCEFTAGPPGPKCKTKGFHYNCTCPREASLPSHALDFIWAQKNREAGSNAMSVSTFREAPVPVSPEDRREAKRKREEEDYEDRVRQMERDMPEIVINEEKTNASDYVYYCETDTESDDNDDQEKVSTKRRKNTVDLITVALIANKYGISNRAAAAIASAVLIDYDYLSLDDAHLLISEKKIRDRREKLLASSAAARTEHVSAPGVVTMVTWDAKETKPMTLKEINGRQFRVSGGKADTYVMTYEPEGQYLGQFVVTGEATKETPYAKLVAIEIYQTVIRLGIPWEQVEVCGHDTENTNTGQWKGVIVFLEFLIGRKLERAPCCLHLNELHYRAVFTALDGGSTSGGSWKGPAGKLLPKLRNKELEFNENFQAIPGSELGSLVELPDDVVKDLSSDQKLLYQLVKMVKTGVKLPNIEKFEIGGISLARWLTHSSAMILIYCSKHNLTEEATKKLKLIVTHITNCYAPMWFIFKSYPLLADAPKHWFRLLRIIADSDPEVREIALKSITRNSYYFHSESILLCYVCSKDREERLFAVEKIKQIRARSEDPTVGDTSYRTRSNPKKLNITASKLHEVIPDSDFKHESYLTCSIRTDQLQNLVESPLVIKPYPSNTQSVERAIKEMTEAGQRVSTEERRDGVIVARQIANFVLPQNSSKKDMEKLFSAKKTKYSDSVKAPKKNHSI